MTRMEVLEEIEKRFGIDKKIFNGYEFLLQKDKVYILSKYPDFDVKIVSAGFLFARLGGNIKPSTNMIQVFGKHATKNIIELDPDQTKKIISGQDILVENIKPSIEDGYVILRYKNYNLGCGFLKKGKIKNQIPKGKRTNVELL